MLGKYIYTVVGAAVICSVCMAITPNGQSSKAVSFVCSIIMLFAVFSPISEMDIGEYSMSLAKYRQEAQEILNDTEIKSEEMNRRYIEAEYCAYILDKAEINGVPAEDVNVTVEWCRDGYWYPTAAEIIITADCADTDLSFIKRIIESELGIPVSMQIWRSTDAEDR